MTLYWQEALRAIRHQQEAADRAKWARLHRDAKPGSLQSLERAKEFQGWAAFHAKRARRLVLRTIPHISVDATAAAEHASDFEA